MTDVQNALRLERNWTRHLRSLDCGSYCENASPEALSAAKVAKAYKELADALLAHERAGYSGPPGQTGWENTTD